MVIFWLLLGLFSFFHYIYRCPSATLPAANSATLIYVTVIAKLSWSADNALSFYANAGDIGFASLIEWVFNSSCV